MTAAIDDMRVTAIANWFGSARSVADRIGRELSYRPMCVVPFAGGMSELPYINADKIIVNDGHRHVVNLARVIADPVLMPRLMERLQCRIFHPDELAEARRQCLSMEAEPSPAEDLFGGCNPALAAATPELRLDWAEAYFVATWMSRGGNSGTRGEFKGKLPVRYSPNGGGSAQRFWNSVGGVGAWHRVFGRCEFTTDDAFATLEQTHDSPRVNIYCDAPWPDAGDGYAHSFGEPSQRKLAAVLGRFKQARVVVRFGDHPLIRDLYPESAWTWVRYPNRQQQNGSFEEVLLINGPSFSSPSATATEERP